MNSITSIIGLLLALFIPGFCITWIFFREVKVLERILLSVTFSIMISIAISISLGYNQNVKSYTGGITPGNVWKWELVITGFLMTVAYLVNRHRIKFNNIPAIIRGYKNKTPKLSKPKEIVKYKKL